MSENASDAIKKNVSNRERSRAYPVMSLNDAIVRLGNINTNIGVKGQFNRESLSMGMGYSSLNGASSRAVAALVHYGFLNRDKNQYSLSKLAIQYLLPVNDDDRSHSLRIAALSPTLFSEIYTAFKGQVIPKQFVNRLIQEFGIQQKKGPDVERIFKSTMKTGGILQSNGILNDTLKANPEPAVNSEDSLHIADDKNSKLNSTEPSRDYLTFKLPSGLVIGYSQELAPAFAFGAFGVKLKELDDLVTEYVDKQKSELPDDKNV